MAQVFTSRFIGRLAVWRHMRTLICGIWTEFGFVLRSWNLIKMFIQYHALLSYPAPSSSCNLKIIINWRVTWFAPQITYLLLIINWCSMKLIICLKFQEKIRGNFSFVYPVDVPTKISFQLIV